MIGLNQLQGTPANGEPLFVGVRRLLFFAVYGRDGAPDGVRGRIDDAVHQVLDCRRRAVFGLGLRAAQAEQKKKRSRKKGQASHEFKPEACFRQNAGNRIGCCH